MKAVCHVAANYICWDKVLLYRRPATTSKSLPTWKKMPFHHCVSRLGDRTQCEAMIRKRSDRLKVTSWQMCPWKKGSVKKRGRRIKSLSGILFASHQNIYMFWGVVCGLVGYIYIFIYESCVFFPGKFGDITSKNICIVIIYQFP